MRSFSFYVIKVSHVSFTLVNIQRFRPVRLASLHLSMFPVLFPLVQPAYLVKRNDKLIIETYPFPPYSGKGRGLLARGLFRFLRFTVKYLCCLFFMGVSLIDTWNKNSHNE